MSNTLAIGASSRRPIHALFCATAIGQVGNMMTIVAGPWFVLELTGSPAKTGLVSAALVLGGVLPAVLGGPLVDRIGYKRGSVLGDLASAATVGAIPLLYLADALNYWLLVLLVFLLSSFNTQGDTSRYGLVPVLARLGSMPIERANSVDRATVRFGALVGPILAGVLIALFGAANVLLFDAATFVISALLVGFGVPSRLGASNEPSGPTAMRYAESLFDGLRFLRSNHVLLSMVLIATIGNSLDKPLISVIAPVYAEEYFGNARSLGLMVGAFGGGALVGTLMFGAVASRVPRRLTFLSCFVVSPLLGFGVLAVTPPLAVVILGAFAAGLAAGPINPIYETLIQVRTPPEMLGRVFGSITALAYLGIPVGAVLSGVAVQQFGVLTTIVAMGGLYLAVTGGMFFNPKLREMDWSAGPSPRAVPNQGAVR